MPDNILSSWKDVARYLGHSIRTCQRLEQEAGLPIHRMDESPKARIFAYPAEIDRWLDKNAHHKPRPWWRRPAVWAVAAATVLIAVAVFLAHRAGLFDRGAATPAGAPSPGAADLGQGTSGEAGPFLAEALAAQQAYVSECDPKDLERAISLFKQAVAARPASAPARYGLGSCYQNEYLFGGGKASSFDAMTAAYAEALRLAPDLPEALVGMGWSRLLSGQRDEAYGWFHKALDLAPSYPLVNYNVGCFLGHIGLVNKAVVYLTRAIDLGERSVRGFRMRAYYESLAGQYRAAAADTARLCEMNPTNGKMFSAHARNLFMLKDFEGAARELEIASVLSSGDPEVQITWALLEAARGERDKALGSVRVYQARSPGPSSMLAPIYALLGLTDETIRVIQSCLSRDRTAFHRLAFPYPCLGGPEDFVYDKVRDSPGFRKIVADLKAEQDDLLSRYSGL